MSRKCALDIGLAVGASFLAVGAAVENLTLYLFGPGWIWLIGGPTLAAVWAYYTLCQGSEQ